MTHTAYVIPDDFDQPAHTFEWEKDDELFPLMYDKIGSELVESTGDLVTPYGPVRMWVDSRASVVRDLALNVRASTAAQGSGHLAPLCGTVVITGGYDHGAGEWTGLAFDHLVGLSWAMDQMRRSADQARPLDRVGELAREMGEAMDARDREAVARILAELQTFSPAVLVLARLIVQTVSPELLP